MSEPTPGPNTTCPQCQSKRVYTAGKNAILGVRCQECGHWWAWQHLPWTLERAEAYVLWKGRHGGKALGDVWNEDQAYVFMLAGHEGSVGTAARLIVARRAPELYREAVVTEDCPF